MGIQQRGGDSRAPVAGVRQFYQTMSTRGWEWRTPKVEREIRGVKFARSSILAADCADYADGPRLLAANQSNSANAGHPRNPRNPRLLVYINVLPGE